MRKSLLLDSDWTPLHFVSGYRALKLIFKGRAEVISLGEKPSLWDEKMKTPNTTYAVPATLRLLEKVVRKKNPKSPRFRKRVLFNRDGWRCQYCGVKLNDTNITIDHVTPRSKGGPTDWNNCVASCIRCNMKKGAKLPTEVGMNLKRRPDEPRMLHFWESPMRNSWHPDWSMFFASNTYRT